MTTMFSLSPVTLPLHFSSTPSTPPHPRLTPPCLLTGTHMCPGKVLRGHTSPGGGGAGASIALLAELGLLAASGSRVASCSLRVQVRMWGSRARDRVL
eukprot:4116595-Pleurochrysis_carterae.AAC.1